MEITTRKNRKHQMKSLVRGCRLLERMNIAKSGSPNSGSVYFRMLGNYFDRICIASEEGKPVALHTVFLPAEILYAMDIVPMHAETSTWMTATFIGESSTLLTRASELGLATEICSAHRGLAGAFALNIMPRPDVVLWSSLMCDNTAKSGDLLMKLNECPGFFLDHPFSQSEAEVKYLISEMQAMISFLEEHTGHRMDWDKLAEIVAKSDYQIKLAREINELRKAIPSPFPPQRFLELLTPYYLLPGHPEAIEYMELLRDDLAGMVARREGAAPHERFRLMSLYVPPMYLLGFLGKICEEYGAVSVVEPLFSLWGEGTLDPGKPLESLAQKSYMFPEMSAYGAFQQRTLEETVKCAKEYNVNGAIFYAHVGCRQALGTLRLYKDALKEADVPLLTLDFDILDPTVASETEIRGKLVQFFEMLEDR